MNLALVGYGKMGRLLERLAPEHGHTVVLRLDSGANPDGAGITAEAFREVEVAIEFSTPDAVVTNVERLAAIGKDMVVGTTGWLAALPRVEEAVAQAGTGLVWSPNFSVGVNVFFRLVAEAARLLAAEEAYGASAWEIHHAAKKDAPSGTLGKLVEEMRRAGYGRPIDVASNRAGAHPGTHEILFDSAADTLMLRHAARSREGFAHGALKAAHWVRGRRGCHEFADTLGR